MTRSKRRALEWDQRFGKLNSPPKDESWSWFTREMLENPAFRALLQTAASRFVMRLAIEHLSHAGRENGRLKVTWDDLVKYGIRRNDITTAIAIAEALGFVKCTVPGQRSHGDFKGRPANYRLTWLPMREPENLTPATNDWKAHKDLQHAKAAIRSARQQVTVRQQRRREGIRTQPLRQDIDRSNGFETGQILQMVSVPTLENGGDSDTKEVSSSLLGNVILEASCAPCRDSPPFDKLPHVQ